MMDSLLKTVNSFNSAMLTMNLTSSYQLLQGLPLTLPYDPILNVILSIFKGSSLQVHLTNISIFTFFFVFVIPTAWASCSSTLHL